MQKRFLAYLVVIAIIFCGCLKVRLIPDYDEQIYNGITQYGEELSTFIKNMGDLAGTEEGTYEKNKLKYNEFESKLTGLIARAQSVPEGSACKLEGELLKRIEKIFKDEIPKGLLSDDIPEKEQDTGCNERLLKIVEKQLFEVEKLHKDKDHCAWPDQPELTCIRPATSGSLLNIINQSITAVSVVEMAKKQ